MDLLGCRRAPSRPRLAAPGPKSLVAPRTVEQPMSSDADKGWCEMTVESERPVDEQSNSRPRGALKLPQATALIVGSIIGVGIFNLPGSLAAYGPISLFAMLLTTVGALALAVMFARVATRLPAGGGPDAHPPAGLRETGGLSHPRVCRVSGGAG